MTYHSPDEKVKFSKRHWVEQAINLAMQQRWDEAVTANQTILENFPSDVDAHNRLGKALTELGKYVDALETYKRAAEFDQNNTIARKNIQRLSALAAHPASATSTPAAPRAEERVDPRLFLEEMGKTEVTRLFNLAQREVLARMTAGDQVYLHPEGKTIQIRNSRNEVLGQLEPRLGQRLLGLITGGNKYAAAITALNENEVRVILREMFQHPSQVGKVSFPHKNVSNFRAYTKDSAVLRYGTEDEEDEDFGNDDDMGDDLEYDGDDLMEEEAEAEPDDDDDDER